MEKFAASLFEMKLWLDPSDLNFDPQVKVTGPPSVYFSKLFTFYFLLFTFYFLLWLDPSDLNFDPQVKVTGPPSVYFSKL